MSSETQASERLRLNYDQLRELLPYEWPFLLIDRVVDGVAGQRVTAEKCVSGTESFVPGHFRRQAVFPGVLLLESMAQALAVAALTGLSPSERTQPFLLGGIRNARFERKVQPGDRVVLEAVLETMTADLGLGHCAAHVDGARVAQASFSFGRAGGST